MSDTPRTPPSQPAPAPAAASDFRSLVIVCYFLFLIACVNGLTAVIGVVIAHTRRRAAEGTIWQGHFDNLILVFWVFVTALLIATVSWPLGIWAGVSALFVVHSPALLIWPTYLFVLLTLFIVVSFPILIVWYFYRTIRGLIRATEARPYRG
jgi:uncharacterized membrane protein